MSPNPGFIAPTHVKQPRSAFSFPAAVSAIPSAPPNRNNLSLCAPKPRAFNRSRRSAPGARSLIGKPRSRAIQMIGMPSGGQSSLSSNDCLNSASDRLLTKKFRFGVEMRRTVRSALADLSFQPQLSGRWHQWGYREHNKLAAKGWIEAAGLKHPKRCYPRFEFGSGAWTLENQTLRRYFAGQSERTQISGENSYSNIGLVFKARKS